MRTQAGPARPGVVLIASKREWTGRSLETILAPRGYVVLKSYTVLQTIERVRRDQPDAIIIDAQLADGSGHDVCRRLRARSTVTPSTPVLLTLPMPPTRRDRVDAFRAGAWDCLGEPLDAEEVLALLGAFVAAKLDADQARSEGLVDEATGLYNVRGLTRRARELASHASRNRAALACVVLAPEPSTAAADAAPGDGDPVVPRYIVRALQAAGRRSDAIGRWGPSAFAVVALETNAAQARRLAERLADAIRGAPDDSARPTPAVRLQAGYDGVADFHAASIDPVDLMLRATAALRKTRTHPPRSWLRGFDEDEVAPEPT